MAAAEALRRTGRFGEAEAALSRAISQAPDDADLRLAYGYLMAEARRPEAALAGFDVALKLAPRRPDAWRAKAWLVRHLGDFDAARMHYERALDLDSASADALAGLAGLAQQRGDAAEARALASRALALDVSHGEAGWVLARAALDQRDFAVAEAQLRAMLRAPGLAPLQRAELELSLGDALDGLGQPVAAFKAYAAGKARQRSVYAERAASRPGETAKARALLAAMAASGPEAWPPAPDPALDAGEPDVHVFLLGFPRSGTTLLEQALAGHPRVTALEERPTLAEPIDALLMRTGGLERLAGLSAEESAHWRRRYWAAVRGHGIDPAGKVFVDKAPGETANLVLIARLFPRARILFALRDPRDVVLSCFRRGFEMNAMTYEFTALDAAARCYDAVMASAFVARERFAPTLLEVRHEALVADAETVLRGIAGFLDLDWRAEMLDVAATANTRAVRTPSAAQVREGLNARGVGGWRAYEAELAPVLPILELWVRRLGYR